MFYESQKYTWGSKTIPKNFHVFCARSNNNPEFLFMKWNTIFVFLLSYLKVPFSFCTTTSGGSKGGARDARPLGVQILSISCSFWENLGKIVCWRPARELAPPPPGNPPLTMKELIYVWTYFSVKQCRTKGKQGLCYMWIYSLNKKAFQ